jgi:type VI secretion system protein ImpJ
MFLRPHHFQAAQRYWDHLLQRNDKWDQHYNWGLRSIEIDLDALANYRGVVRSLRARLRDGTLVSIPDDGLLPEVDLKPAFAGMNAVTLFLAVPKLQLGRANVSDRGVSTGGRFTLDSQQLEDENTGINTQAIQVRLLNLKLLLSTQDHAGYEVLPIARFQKSARAEATPELDETYIPPLLACDAWKPLYAGILQTIYDQIGRYVEQQATQVTTRNIGFDSQSQGDRLIFEQLRVLNEAYTFLGIQVFALGIHPLSSYLELCRIVGQLAIFAKERRPPELRKYDHDNLGECFYRVKQILQALIEEVGPLSYRERPFVGSALRIQVTDLEPGWLEEAWQMYIGVQSPLSPEQIITLLTVPGHMDMKIGSVNRVDRIFKEGRLGLRFTHKPDPPRILPSTQRHVYFQVERSSELQEWEHVRRELSLAIRLRQVYVAGNIQGQKVLTINFASGQNTTMQFTLFVVPKESA